MELTRIPITGTVTRLVFSDDKSRLLVSAISKEGVAYRDYDIRSIGRHYYKKTGKLYVGNQVSNPLSDRVYFVIQTNDNELSLRYYDFNTKLQSEPLMIFEGDIHKLLVDPYDKYIYTAESNESPLIIKKINLATK